MAKTEEVSSIISGIRLMIEAERLRPDVSEHMQELLDSAIVLLEEDIERQLWELHLGGLLYKARRGDEEALIELRSFIPEYIELMRP